MGNSFNAIILATLKQWVISIGADFRNHGIKALQHWQKCIVNGDDCGEKVLCS